MKRTLLVCILCSYTIFSCQSREREKQISEKEAELNMKEQELLLREKTLQFKEQELKQRLLQADSIVSTAAKNNKGDSTANNDTVATNPALTGNWAVQMTCVETSCPGSALGDIRNEQWNLFFEGKHLVAKATDRGNLVRTYSGIYNENAIELIEHRDTSMTYDTRMVVRLRMISSGRIVGQREIIRENDCKIVYEVIMDKL